MSLLSLIALLSQIISSYTKSRKGRFEPRLRRTSNRRGRRRRRKRKRQLAGSQGFRQQKLEAVISREPCRDVS